jgi:RNA polymerase sigma factor (sigma-70 family)
MQDRARWDWKLVEAHLDGDANAFVELVRKHSGLIASICRTRSSLHAQDVVDETWYRVLLRIERGDIAWRRTFASWIGGIALNVLQAKSMRAESGEIPVEIPDQDLDLVGLVADMELHEALNACIEDLDPRMRSVYRLHYVEELSFVGLAQHLECSEANVRQKLVPKLKRLVEICLGKKGFGRGSNREGEVH